VGRKHIEVTTLTFLYHVMSPVTWPFDSLYAILLLVSHWNSLYL